MSCDVKSVFMGDAERSVNAFVSFQGDRQLKITIPQTL